MKTNQQNRRTVGGRCGRGVRLPVVVLDFERAQRERRERNEALGRVEAGLPGDRSHVTYDEIASAARDAERRPDPLKCLIAPLAASVDKAVALRCPGMVLATFDRIDSLLTTLRRQLMGRVPEPMHAELWGAPSLYAAFKDETQADADADIAQALAVVKSDDPRIVEEARDKTLAVIHRGRRFVTACDLTLSRGGVSHGALIGPRRSVSSELTRST
jgi:hypothetical protein